MQNLSTQLLHYDMAQFTHHMMASKVELKNKKTENKKILTAMLMEKSTSKEIFDTCHSKKIISAPTDLPSFTKIRCECELKWRAVICTPLNKLESNGWIQEIPVCLLLG